jgi:hypothetical protein
MLTVVYVNGPDPVIHVGKCLSEQAVNPQSGLAMERKSQQAPQRARLNSLGCITERLAIRVKGLTSVFHGLLLTKWPDPPPGGRSKERRGCGISLFLMAADA